MQQDELIENNINDQMNENLIPCPICNALFDTAQAVQVHFNNEHNESHEPSPNKIYAQTQPVLNNEEFVTPILHKRKRKRKRRLIASDDSVVLSTIKKNKTDQKRKKQKISDISNVHNVSDDSPEIRIIRRRKKRKLSDSSEDS